MLNGFLIQKRLSDYRDYNSSQNDQLTWKCKREKMRKEMAESYKRKIEKFIENGRILDFFINFLDDQRFPKYGQ